MKLKPTADNIVLKQTEAEETTEEPSEEDEQ